jgi:hypothetical protein
LKLKFDLANGLRSAFELMGCEVEFSGSYPGWTNSNSEILDVLVPIYEKQTVKNQSSGVSRRIRMWNSGNNYRIWI